MIDARFCALLKWDRQPALENRRSTFKTAYNKTLDKLEREITHLEGRDIRIEAGFALHQIRNDGWPRGGAAPAHPGVVLYFTSKDGPLCFPCGTFGTMGANLQAIALTLEALRAIDRYGATVGHEQYRGFTALPPAPKPMSVEGAAEFIAMNSSVSRGVVIEQADGYRLAYRQAATRLHPDVTGSNEAFYRLGKAKEVLDKHHGLARAGGAS